MRMDLEECLTQFMFIVYNGHDGAIVFPYADPVEDRFIQVGVTVHILPGGLQPIPIFILWLKEANQKIADDLVISIGTVKGHVSNILSKLHLANRTQAALYALREGLASLETDSKNV